MSKIITAVPESITREQYVALIGSFGFEAERLISLEFRADGVHAVVIEVDENGHRVTDKTRGEDGCATSTVYVPVREV